ncbi:uncharacterized protein PV09_07907 [Verruconis gallopava]|uniref:3-phytase n=1 Tax=Verruconis gallopava TaxID=253628 RepID=A0A0D1YI99_9PEZI|nr:uncharacterized protein PV09_07907 [Verruconis gallopava]KIW00552.1 hypothetical protein PV09_07907 [Verruconis gallopava]
MDPSLTQQHNHRCSLLSESLLKRSATEPLIVLGCIRAIVLCERTHRSKPRHSTADVTATMAQGELLGRQSSCVWHNGSWKGPDIFEPDPGARRSRYCIYQLVSACLVASGIFVMLTYTLLFVSGFSAVSGGVLNEASSSSVPQYFQTTPEIYAGPTPTGVPAFLAETNPAPFPSTSYIPNAPLETQVPIAGNINNSNIYQLHGQLSHYFPNPDGFGVNEFSLPKDCNISFLYMLSRHGARYPTSDSGAAMLAAKLKNASSTLNATGDLAFLNTWNYKLGANILVPVGKQELFDSGVLHQYMYGHLYPNNGTKIVARSTTEDRMTQSAEYFLAGFFGLDWPQNATLELIIEENGFNNSLAGRHQCPNAKSAVSTGGKNASAAWQAVYLKNATARIAKQISGYNWTLTDTYNAQSMCAYETVALGYSAFCGLFTYEEWLGYEYSVDLSFSGNNAFQSPTGRAVGIGWQQELLARLQHHYITGPDGNVNYTLDGMPSTFPLDQTLNFDFSHDTNIMSILTALGFTQFNATLPTDHIPMHDLVVSHLEPFGARLDIEVINAPRPVNASRTSGGADAYTSGNATQYIHFILNQRTLPMGRSFSECGSRTDGWCELSTFIKVQSTMFNESQYEYACFGNYSSVPYGTLTNGVPQAES